VEVRYGTAGVSQSRSVVITVDGSCDHCGRVDHGFRAIQRRKR
jgi:hypothetical protein